MTKISDYFDLSKKISRETQPAVAANAAARADRTGALTLESLPLATATVSRPEQLTVGWQILIYAILVIAILSSRFLDLYRAGVWQEFALDLPYLVFVAIASLLAFPAVYDRARLSKDQPVFVQIALIFTTGMGWEKLIATAIGK